MWYFGENLAEHFALLNFCGMLSGIRMEIDSDHSETFSRNAFADDEAFLLSHPIQSGHLWNR